MISKEMHQFAVKMAAHERIVKQHLIKYSHLNHLSQLELHAILSKLVYEIEKDNEGLTHIRERAMEASDLQEAIKSGLENLNPEKSFEVSVNEIETPKTAQGIIDEIVKEAEEHDYEEFSEDE